HCAARESTPAARDAPPRTPAARFTGELKAVAGGAMGPPRSVYRGPEAASPLFRVAAGLDWLVVGEPQILGQVKEALTAASELKSTGALTHRLFPTAFSVGKRVRSEGGLREGGVWGGRARLAPA